MNQIVYRVKGILLVCARRGGTTAVDNAATEAKLERIKNGRVRITIGVSSWAYAREEYYRTRLVQTFTPGN
jgi:hypothetical protein